LISKRYRNTSITCGIKLRRSGIYNAFIMWRNDPMTYKNTSRKHREFLSFLYSCCKFRIQDDYNKFCNFSNSARYKRCISFLYERFFNIRSILCPLLNSCFSLKIWFCSYHSFIYRGVHLILQSKKSCS
jgi:hypothetical protein